MDKILTIGFTKKSAQFFFELLEHNKVDVLLDVRLKNTSQLAGFSRYPDIKYFLKTINKAQYISDTIFAPTDEILKNYKQKKINWEKYVVEYEKLMKKRRIEEYILEAYKRFDGKTICLLCSEEKADYCHRSLVAQKFKQVLGGEIVNL